MIQFFNTLSSRKDSFEPLVPGEVKMYTCGPTVYDFPHIGNYRAYIFEDLLKRFLKFMEFKVTHVMNITDVDDKTIKGAQAKGISLQDYTKEFTKAFFVDIQTLNIDRADFYPRATEHIQEMAQMVKELQTKGYAYERDGSYYFSIAKFKKYGQLSKIDLSGRKSGVRIDSDEYAKESIHDFALWKAPKGGEPVWDSVLGPGRPGWHVECSVMSTKYLGETFDIHCGGVDNIFPHHENEIAQSEAYTGKKFVNYWMHCQHLIRDGEKMSKSMGNTITLRELIEEHQANPAAIRLLLMSTHYRKMLNFTFDALSQAQESLSRIENFIHALTSSQFQKGETTEIAELVDNTVQKFKEGLCDDLNISLSLSAVFEMIKKANIDLQQNKILNKDKERLLSALSHLNTVLGLAHVDEIITSRIQNLISEEQRTKINRREEARKAKDFVLADQLRKELLEEGILLEDTKDGPRWKCIQRQSWDTKR